MKYGAIIFLLGSLLVKPITGLAQNHSTSSEASTTAHSSSPIPVRNIEDLNLVGADTSMPPLTDSTLGADSAYRRALFRHGFLLRTNVVSSYAQDTVNDPVPADQQVYVGDRPFESAMTNPILTYDLRQFHLRGAQFNVGAALQWVSWNAAGPKAGALSTMYLYKSFGEDRFETKIGYITNDFEFVGLQVGGSVASGAQGVYAVLPFEVGLSHFPLTAPSINLKASSEVGLYGKMAFQRSLDPAGGSATIARNATGLRFMPKGDKLLTVYEAGYKRDAAADSLQSWIRGGYMHNATPYPNSRTGGATSGNYCAYLLADHQLHRSDSANPGHGFYAGLSAMAAPADMNVYTQYYEARLYLEAPFHSRPNDMISVVSSRSIYSRDTIRSLIAEGKTASYHSNSITGSYSVHLARGYYASLGMSYVTGPAVTPRLPNALTLNIHSNIFF